jgi:hypothetical protein
MSVTCFPYPKFRFAECKIFIVYGLNERLKPYRLNPLRPNYKRSEALNASFNPKRGAREEENLDKGAEYPPGNNPVGGYLCANGRGHGLI